MTSAKTPFFSEVEKRRFRFLSAMVVYPPVVSGDTMGAYEVYTYQYPGGPLSRADLYSEGTLMGGAAFRTTTYAYDHEGQTTSESDLKGLVGTWTYDARGRVSASADGQGNTTHYCYTAAGSLYQELYPGASIVQNGNFDGQYTGTAGSVDTLTYLRYDADQNPIHVQDGRGVVVSYQYNDPESLVTQVSYSNLPSSVTPINSVNYAYDGYGRRMSMDDTTGTGQAGSRKVTTYDDLDEMETATTSFANGPQGQEFTYAHYNDGSRKSMLTPTGVANPLFSAGYVYAYDNNHRLTGVTFPWYKRSSNVGPAEQDALTYYANNWLYTSTNSRFGTTYTYDARGFLMSLSNISVANGGTVSDFTGITYDAAGNRTGFAASLPDFNTSHNFSHTLAYTYDQRDELTEETSTASGGNNYSGDLYDQTFGFDLAYNRTAFMDVTPSGNSSFSYMFGSDNQNTSGGFAYDGSGNPTQYSGSSYAYAYDPEQRLTGIGTNFAAHYDGDGMRDYVTANGTTTYFLYDGSSPVLEETYSASSGTTTIQVADGFADGWRERASGANGGFSAYAFDPQGTLQGEDVNSNTLRTAVNTYVYDGYGDFLGGLHVGTGALTGYNQDPVQFGGQYGYYTDLSTGEVDLTHRYYDPSTGHFLNRDPIGYNGGQNLYAFCGNNPITGSDPEGTSSIFTKQYWTNMFRYWFLGNMHPADGKLGGNRGDEGLDADEMSTGGTSQLVQHPSRSAKVLRAGAVAAVGTMALSVIGAAGGPEGEEELELGLGMKGSLPNLKKLAPQAKDFEALKLDPYDPAFSDNLLSAMTKAKTIHFDISGMQMLNGANGVLTGPIEWNAKGSTNWELRTVMDNPTLRDKTVFYNAGKRIGYQAILKLP